MSFSMSKYWVIRTRFTTSVAVVPGTDLWNSSHRIPQTLDDGLPLLGNALTLQGLALGVAFGRLDLEDPIRFVLPAGGAPVGCGRENVPKPQPAWQ